MSEDWMRWAYSQLIGDFGGGFRHSVHLEKCKPGNSMKNQTDGQARCQ